MNVNEFSARKTGLLFFDMLNVYYLGASEETQKRMQPVVDNAVRLVKTARKVSMPIFYAMANHRPDGKSRSMIVTDTDMRLRRWPGDECKPTVHGAVEGSWEQGVIEEIAAQPEDYVIPKYRWSTFHGTYFDLALRSRGIDTIIISGDSVVTIPIGEAAATSAGRTHSFVLGGSTAPAAISRFTSDGAR